MSDNSFLIEKLNKDWSVLKPEEILIQASAEFGEELLFASSMGAEDQVMTQLIFNNNLPVQVITLDTGRIFPETYDLIHRTNSRYGNIVKVVFPEAKDVEEMVNSKGIDLFYESIENRKLCCGIRKINPLQRVLSGKRAWITGLRRAQSLTRGEMKLVEWDASFNLIKINPLINWSEEDIWKEVNEHNIPFSVLHKHGFPSIGCQPCTRAIEPGENIRSGRWWWENPDTKECGLHKN
jgi:phosphoadenosine phosphosulfate reductase